jgi:hypothetical protein
MNELPLKLGNFLADAANKLRNASLPRELGDAMERLAGQVDKPCVIAVVGRMKAGKSTFINALLGEDLAKVGATETTATINHFLYGRPNPARPIRCHWQNGNVTDENLAFMDGLQGNDGESLERAKAVKHLEYHLLNPYLERATLVDTPGTSTVVDQHIQRTAEFLALQRQMVDRHTAETRRLAREADAVIYLVGQVARITDKAFLDEFHDVTGDRSKALNSIGVLAKIDLHPEVLTRRQKLANTIGAQLKNSLNAVIPVSAGIQRAVDHLQSRGRSGVHDFLIVLKRIPPKWLEKFLDSEEFYRQLQPADCPVSVAERELLLGDTPWAVFTTLAKTATSMAFDPTKTESEWRSLAGFDRLHELLDRHFIRRAQLLRCHRIVCDARALLDDVRYKNLPELYRRDREHSAKFDRFLRFVRGAGGDSIVAKELEEFLVQQNDTQDKGKYIEVARNNLDRRLAEFIHQLEELNADFEALQVLEENKGDFTGDELQELRALYGLYESEPGKRFKQEEVLHLSSRQQYWHDISQSDMVSARREIAERAVVCYGVILAKLGEST